MIPYEFEYKQAGSVDEAVSLLSEHGYDAKLLAGGHSLIPAMKLRLSAPKVLIDVSGVSGLADISESDGQLHIGALTTHRRVEISDLVKQHCGVLAETAGRIGDPQVRNKGTIGGSIAHADPAADYPALVLALNATIHLTGPSGSRSIAADDFFQDFFATALNDDEVITHVSFPVLEGGAGAAYAKFANPASRYAVVGVAAKVTVQGGVCTEARVAITGAASHAFRATNVEEALTDNTLDEDTIKAALDGKFNEADLMSDLSGSAAYRAHLCAVMGKRALLQAAERAG
ncbi:MAG TPA: xanthine dehydrogenase family protein subunit M [Rhodothermales bacterium]|nr:xanthine dehydrogenase family protein subunit M [Rhodothermales bacterium]